MELLTKQVSQSLAPGRLGDGHDVAFDSAGRGLHPLTCLGMKRAGLLAGERAGFVAPLLTVPSSLPFPRAGAVPTP